MLTIQKVPNSYEPPVVRDLAKMLPLGSTGENPSPVGAVMGFALAAATLAVIAASFCRALGRCPNWARA